MYKRRKKENGLEGVGQRKVILVYERSRHTAMSKEETLVGECNKMYTQGFGEEKEGFWIPSCS